MNILTLSAAIILLIAPDGNCWHVHSPATGAKILGGNYGRSGLDFIPNLRKSRNNPDPSDPAEAEITPTETANRKATIADVQKAYTENFKAVMMKAINISKMDMGKEVQDVRPNCEETLKTACMSLVPEDCRKIYIRCLTGNKQMFNSLTKVIGESLGLLCKPLKTKYMQIFEPSEGGFPHLQTYSAFLSYLKATPRDYPTIIPQLANAMMPNIIEYSLTPLLPLKGVLASMKKEMMVQQPGAREFEQNNPGCLTLQMSQSIEIFVDLMNKDAALTDILMPGFAFFNTVSKYMSGDTFGMTVLAETMRMFTGTGSGFACNAGQHMEQNGGSYDHRKKRSAENTFGNGNCDEFGKNPQSGFTLPPKLLAETLDASGLVNPSCSGKSQSSKPPTKVIDELDADVPDEESLDEGGKAEEVKDDEGNAVPETDSLPPTEEAVPKDEEKGEEVPTEPVEALEDVPKDEEVKEEGTADESVATDPVAAETGEGDEEVSARKRRKSTVGELSK